MDRGERTRLRRRRVTITLLCGSIGGTIFYLLHLPLPWILGAAAATMLLNVFKSEANGALWPRWCSEFGIMTIAYVLGRTITMQTAKTIAGDLPMMIFAASMWLFLCVLIGILFARFVGLHEATGILGCMPGGLSQMVLLADATKGADAGTVALIQTSRLVVVLYTVPFLATVFAQANGNSLEPVALANAMSNLGTEMERTWPLLFGYILLPFVPTAMWLLKWLKIPAYEFIGPVVFVGAMTIAGCTWPAVPDPFISVAQLAIGIYIGSRVQPKIVFTHKRLAPFALVSAFLLVFITVLSAWLLSSVTSSTVVTWFLALAPGGLGEVAATALALEADVAKVTAFQLFRLIFILFIAPLVLKKLFNYRQRRLDHVKMLNR